LTYGESSLYYKQERSSEMAHNYDDAEHGWDFLIIPHARRWMRTGFTHRHPEGGTLKSVVGEAAGYYRHLCLVNNGPDDAPWTWGILQVRKDAGIPVILPPGPAEESETGFATPILAAQDYNANAVTLESIRSRELVPVDVEALDKFLQAVGPSTS